MRSDSSVQHPGDRKCYRNGCRLPQCRAAHTRYRAACRRRRTDDSVDHLVDSECAVAFVRALKDKGWRMKDIVAATGISRSVFTRITRARPNPTVRRSTLDKLRLVMRRSTTDQYLQYVKDNG